MPLSNLKASKRLSYLLRHSQNPLYIELSGGWASVKTILQALDISRSELETIVTEDEKGRYSFDTTGTRIRANQGHSIPNVEIPMEQPDPPEFLYHGTATRFLDDIMQDGLKPMKRQWVHLSKLSTREVKKLGRQFRDNSSSYVRYADSRKGMEESGLRPNVLQIRDIGAVKEMPTFDPDSEISGLTLTIPTWVGSIERAKKATNMQFTTKAARKQLEQMLLQLRRAIDEMVTDIRGCDHG